MDPKEARKLTEDKVSLQGNLDPCVLFANKEYIEESVRRMLKEFGVQKYIGNLGHGLLPEHNPENVGWFIHAVHNISEELNKQE